MAYNYRQSAARRNKRHHAEGGDHEMSLEERRNEIWCMTPDHRMEIFKGMVQRIYLMFEDDDALRHDTIRLFMMMGMDGLVMGKVFLEEVAKPIDQRSCPNLGNDSLTSFLQTFLDFYEKWYENFSANCIEECESVIAEKEAEVAAKSTNN